MRDSNGNSGIDETPQDVPQQGGLTSAYGK